MSESRTRIFARLRADGTSRIDADGGSAAEPRSAGVDLPVRRFDWDCDERLARFRSALEAVRGEVHPVGTDWPARLHGLLAARGVRSLAYGPAGPEGAALAAGWPADEIRLVPYVEPVEGFRGTLFDSVDAGFTACRGAVAETGSLVLWPGPAEPRLLSLVPRVHAAVLDAAEIRSTFAELIEEQGWAGGMPTNALLVTGPSRSADIEQTLTYGVHGPEALIVLVRGVREAELEPALHF